MNAEQVGRQIAMLRKERGMTQKDLATVLHVTDKAVSKWERGLNFPEITLLKPLAAALNTTVIQLLSLEDATPQSAISAVTELSVQERKQLVKELRMRAIIKILVELALLAALLYASKLFADHGIYGLAQIVTMGMMGFAGMLIGSELYELKRLPELR